jgi:hypothetical protein
VARWPWRGGRGAVAVVARYGELRAPGEGVGGSVGEVGSDPDRRDRGPLRAARHGCWAERPQGCRAERGPKSGNAAPLARRHRHLPVAIPPAPPSPRRRDTPEFRADNSALDDVPGSSPEKSASMTGLSWFGVQAGSSLGLSARVCAGVRRAGGSRVPARPHVRVSAQGQLLVGVIDRHRPERRQHVRAEQAERMRVEAGNGRT